MINTTKGGVHVIVTEDDSEVSASCDDDKSNAISNLSINNPNSQFMNAMQGGGSSNNINGTNATGISGGTSTGNAPGKRKRVLKKNKDNSSANMIPAQ